MEVPATEAGILSEIRVSVGEIAPVGAVVGVIGDGTRSAVSTPPIATLAATANKAPPLPSAYEAEPAAALPSASAAVIAPASPQPLAKLDPFFEVRTPDRNFGPARLAGGISVTRWHGGSPAKPASIFRSCAVPARTDVSSPATSPMRGGRPRHFARGRAGRRSGQGAVRARQL